MTALNLGAACLIGTLLSSTFALSAKAFDPAENLLQSLSSQLPASDVCEDGTACGNVLQEVLSTVDLESDIAKDLEHQVLVLPETQTLLNRSVLDHNFVAEFTEPSPDVSSESVGRRPRLKRNPESEDEPLYRPRTDILLERSSGYGPSITLLTPSAFGKDWRQFSVGVGFQERTRFTNNSDGAVGLGFGLGDAEKYVGLDIGVTFTDLSDFFNRGIVSFKLHRRLESDLAIAVGVNDALTWGNGDVDGPSPYGVVSKIFVLKEDTSDFLSQVAVSAGVGTGRYRSEFNIFNGNDDPNPFGSVAMRLFDPINVITEWSGQDLSVGLSIRPLKKIPIVITPAFTDITGNAGDGERFILGVGYSTRF